MKKCQHCQKDFLPDKRNYGIQRYCSHSCKNKDWKQNNKARVRSTTDKYYAKIKADPILWEVHKARGRKSRHTIKGRYRNYARKACERGYEFRLTLEEFKTFWQKECYYCGETNKEVGIDRVDNSVGYTLENCVPSCRDCNVLKHSQSMQKFIEKCHNTIRLSIKCKKIIKRLEKSVSCLGGST